MAKESFIKFPCEFSIKIMGTNSENLIPEVTAIITKHVEMFDPESSIKTRLSSNQTYLSITATINATSQEQLDEIYQALNQHELVKITL